MKYSTIIGLVLSVVGLFLFILQEPDYTDKDFYIAGFLGLGIGLILGGFMGFAQKKRNKIVKTVLKPAEETTPAKESNSNPVEESGVKL